MPTTDELQAQINALQQQLNQIIGMSNDDYVLTYSGEEVDDLLGKAASAVRYDTAQSLTAAQQAQARGNIAAAPDGFGYGGALDTVSGATDEEFLAAVEAKLAAMPYMGAMQINWGSYPALDGLARVGTLEKHNGGQYASITGYSYGGTAITRCKNAGIWGPWEWVNPPLVAGVEYRTTERYLGKPVFNAITSGFEVWATEDVSLSSQDWPSMGKSIKLAVSAGSTQNIVLPRNRTLLCAVTDNIRSGAVIIQTAAATVKSITTIVPLANWGIVAGDALSVNATEQDGRYEMYLSITMI